MYKNNRQFYRIFYYICLVATVLSSLIFVALIGTNSLYNFKSVGLLIISFGAGIIGCIGSKLHIKRINKYYEQQGPILDADNIETDILDTKNMKSAILEDENVEAILVLKGVKGQLYVTDKCVVIDRNGVSDFSGVFKGKKEIPFSSITAIQVREATKSKQGYIQFSIIGGTEVTGIIAHPLYDENTIMFNIANNELVEKIKNHIQEKINEGNLNHKSASNTLSPADEISKFKKLLDDNVISQEEFEAKKKQLLG